jgi:nicotinamidase-related amidase
MMMNSSTAAARGSIPASLKGFVAPSQTALIMWDFQKGLAGRASNAGPMLDAAQKLLAAADRAGVMVIWSRHVLPPFDILPGPWMLLMMKRQGVSRPEDVKPMFQAGSEEGEFMPGFQPAPHHLVLEKSQPSLFVDTPLDNRLKARGIRTLVLAGFATDIGIDFNARHASAEGYFAIVAEDACGAHTPEGHERSLAFLRNWVQVANSGEIISAWS